MIFYNYKGKDKQYSNYFIFGIFVVVLFFSLYKNAYNLVDQSLFDDFQKDSESLVIGKLSVANKYGVFHKGGLTGWIQDVPHNKSVSSYQYDIYNNQLDYDISKYVTYNSQSGGQAILYATLDKILPLDSNKRLEIYWAITALLSSICLTLFMLWVKRNFGLVPVLTTLLLIVLTHWFTIFGRNLWWSLWCFYIPFISLLYYFENCVRKEKQSSVAKVFIISFIALSLKCFFSGFEFITTTCIMSITPVIYYWIQENWTFKVFITKSVAAGTGLITAILFSFLVLASQIATVKGSILKGFEHIFHAFGMRTNGDPSKYHKVFLNSLEASHLEVFKKYMNGIAFDFNPLIDIGHTGILIITFSELLLIFALFSLVLFKVSKRKVQSDISKNKIYALIITTWISILAPISWIVIFKGHSYIHTHMNFIIWYMPYALFGFVILGTVFSYLINLLTKRTTY